ncbi:MAG: hypothetical protein ABSE97_02545 [Verrucomicrobiota bacterium]|jgi:hypothetical protein
MPVKPQFIRGLNESLNSNNRPKCASGGVKSCKHQVSFSFGTESSASGGMNTIQEFKFACPICHQHIICDPDTAGMQIECPSCWKTIVVPKSTKTTGTKLMLQGMQTRVRPTLPMIVTGSQRITAVPQMERASMLLLAAAATAVLIIAGMIFYHSNAWSL